MKRSAAIMIILSLSALLFSCGGAPDESAAGSLTFSAVWVAHKMSPGPQAASEIYHAAPAGVMTVRVMIYQSNPSGGNSLGGVPPTPIMHNDFPASQGSAVINGVPIGPCWVVLEGLDGSGNIVYQGTSTQVNVQAGQTADCGVITLAPYVPRPSSPTNLTAHAGNGQVTLSWSDSTYATSYNIYSGPSITATSNGTLISNTSATTYTQTGLTNGTQYCYSVTAVSSGGESYAAPQICATPGAPPAAPTGVVATAGDGQVIVTWNPDSAASGNYIYWSTSPGVTLSSSNQLSPGLATSCINGFCSYTITGLINGTTYYYVVTATASNGAIALLESPPSIEVSATPQAGATMPLAALATSITDTTATLNGSINNPTGYSTTVWFEYGTTTAYGNSTTQSVYASSGSVTLNVNVSGLQQTTTYHYHVVTQNSGGTFYSPDMTFTTMQTPQVLAAGSFNPQGIAVDSTRVYWTNYFNGTVQDVLTSGGTPTTLVSGMSSPGSIAVDDTNVYIAENNSSGKIKMINKTSKAVTSLATTSYPSGIVVDSTNAYWYETGTSGAVKMVNISGAPTVQPLASGLSNVRSIALDSSFVYWIDDQGIKKISKTGGTVTVLTPQTGGATIWSSLTVDSSNVYWNGNGITEISINGGTPSILSNNLWGLTIIGVDTTSLYVYGSNYISTVSLSDGSVSPLAYLGSFGTPSFTMDTASIYWADSSGIKKINK